MCLLILVKIYNGIKYLFNVIFVVNGLSCRKKFFYFVMNLNK